MQLDEIREQIDKTDDAIIRLFKERMELAASVAAYKKENNMPILNSKRERDIISRVIKDVPEDLRGYTKMLMQTLFSLSRSYQMQCMPHTSKVQEIISGALEKTPSLMPQNAVIACQGTEGAYSQKATEKIFPIPEIMFFDNFRGVFSAVESGLCQYGVLPIENSIEGSVSAVYDLMREYKFYIVRVERLQLHHTLLAKEGVNLSDIREVYSHEQAIGQCDAFLKAHGIRVTKCENTAMAAKIVSESDRRDIAAICSRDCAALYGLHVVSDEVQNSDNNYTRFICISKTPEIYPGASKMSIMVSLPHRPGALYDLISKFSVLGINLSKIESFPIPGHSFAFRFCLDMDISVYAPELFTLLNELENELVEFTFLGSYIEN